MIQTSNGRLQNENIKQMIGRHLTDINLPDQSMAKFYFFDLSSFRRNENPNVLVFVLGDDRKTFVYSDWCSKPVGSVSVNYKSLEFCKSNFCHVLEVPESPGYSYTLVGLRETAIRDLLKTPPDVMSAMETKGKSSSHPLVRNQLVIQTSNGRLENESIKEMIGRHLADIDVPDTSPFSKFNNFNLASFERNEHPNVLVFVFGDDKKAFVYSEWHCKPVSWISVNYDFLGFCKSKFCHVLEVPGSPGYSYTLVGLHETAIRDLLKTPQDMVTMEKSKMKTKLSSRHHFVRNQLVIQTSNGRLENENIKQTIGKHVNDIDLPAKPMDKFDVVNMTLFLRNKHPKVIVFVFGDKKRTFVYSDWRCKPLGWVSTTFNFLEFCKNTFRHVLEVPESRKYYKILVGLSELACYDMEP